MRVDAVRKKPVPIDEHFAYRLSQQLSLIPECPQGETAIEALADHLRRLCFDEYEAERIVTQACDRWERWKGIRGLIELIDAGRPTLPPSNQAQDYGPRPKPACAICGDWGYFGNGDKVQWCSCAMGLETRERMPDLVENLNRKQVKPPNAAAAVERKPITADELEAAFHARQDRFEQMLEEERAALADPNASEGRKEIAREILRRWLGVA